MQKLFLLFFPFLLFGQSPEENRSMLFQAKEISKQFTPEIAKAIPPAPIPLTEKCLNTASVFFSIDLEEVLPCAFNTLYNQELWDLLKEVGVEGIYLKNLKTGGEIRSSIEVDPKWGNNWDDLSFMIQKKGIRLIGKSIGNTVGQSTDFYLALKNYKDYPSIFHLIEIDKKDWKDLPEVHPSQISMNVPWLSLQTLHKKGYVPEKFTPYVKTSSWNATLPIRGVDGEIRRFIFLQENEKYPVLNWLESTFTSSRIASSDLLDSMYNLNQKIIQIDAKIEENMKRTLALWTRKLGGFSMQETLGTIDELKKCISDLSQDTLSRSSLLYAMIAEDTEMLKMIYRLYLENEIDTKKLVHELQPFNEFALEYNELLSNPAKPYKYFDEILTGKALRERLLTTMKIPSPASIPSLCLNKSREDALQTHLLLSFFYAMQPGVFSFSLSDLLGLLEYQKVNPMEPTSKTLYPSLPGQMMNPKSFARGLQRILEVRRDTEIAKGELLEVLNTQNRGVIALKFQLPRGKIQLLVVNFSQEMKNERFDIKEIKKSSAIDLMTNLLIKKPLKSSSITLELPPLTGKVILFQPQYSSL